MVEHRVEAIDISMSLMKYENIKDVLFLIHRSDGHLIDE